MARFQGQIRVGTQGPNIGSNNIAGSEEGIARKQEIFKRFNEEQERKKKGGKDKEIDKDRKERQDKKDREKNKIIVNLKNKLDEFNIIVKENKGNKRPWFFGLEEKFGEWWHGMTIDQVKDKLKSEQIIFDDNNEKGLRREEEKENKRGIIDRLISEQILSCSVELVARGLIELPKDSKRRLVYVYPMGKKQSFNLVAKHQIKFFNEKYLVDKGMTFDRYVEIQELDWSEISGETSDVCNWREKRNVLLHPFLYPFTSKESFLDNAKNFARLLVTKNKIGGFDVADSDKVSDIAVELINKIDLIIVPSAFSRDAFINSGVRPEIVRVLPHGLDDYFLMDDVDINIEGRNVDNGNGEDNGNIDNEDIDNKNDIENVKKTFDKLKELREKGKILVLYFVLHSSYRKGADLVEEVIKRVEKRLKEDGNENEICLVIRSKSLKYFENITDKDINNGKDNIILVDEWLNNRELVKLYDLCSVCLVPSRGGGWEMNAMEATSRGLITLAPNAGCFLDMQEYLMMVDIDKDKIVKPLPQNPVHIGNGYEMNMDDFENKLLNVINNFHEIKDKFEDNMYDVREKYSWRNVVLQLDDILMKYGFYE